MGKMLMNSTPNADESKLFNGSEFYRLLLDDAETQLATDEEQLPPTVAFLMRDGSIRFSECDALFAQLAILEESRLSDRLLVIVSTAYLEDELRLLLDKFLLESPALPFNTMAKLALSLGLIAREWFDILNAMAKIRNKFAHHPKAISFKKLIELDPGMKQILDNLYRLHEQSAEERLAGNHYNNFASLFRFIYANLQFAIDHVAAANPARAFDASEIIGMNYLVGLTKPMIRISIDDNVNPV